MQNLIILDENMLSQNTRADCLIFCLDGDLTIGICELKSKYLKVDKIQQQLNNSSAHALKICQSQFPGIHHHFIPILLAKHYKISTYKKLSETKIRIEGKEHRIMLNKCGDKFSEILEINGRSSQSVIEKR